MPHRNPTRQLDVLVIGGGHAGAEAAWAAASLGANTAMVTFRRDAIGRMSCNPAIGGIGKGQMVREVDALGGLMGLVADETGIQFRMLNRRKGPAVWAPRCQSDSRLYAEAVRRRLEACANLTIIEAGVESIEAGELDRDEATKRRCDEGGVRSSALNGRPDTTPPPHGKAELCTPRSTFDIRHSPFLRVRGVTLSDGRFIAAGNVIVTSGTFLRGLMHCGERQTAGGRVSESAATGLSASLAALGLELGRLKTGTPPRLARDSLDLSRFAEQPGDDTPAPFSFMTERIDRPQAMCWIAWTNAAVHALIRDNLHRAPMYSGQIHSRGPRYCPSIEDKIVRFADKERHQIFLEPEGQDSDRIYCNGISTSLPLDVQERIVASIEGLETARIAQPGYAVEYDFVPPQQIDATLMTKRVEGLFLAGQINGTSGYEEAAGQGLMAGINAARRAAGRPPVVLRRDQAYVGVMIDDLVTRGVTEPYRMFTSRAEHRLMLRYDNADARLTPLGRELGLVDDARWRRFEEKQQRLDALMHALDTLRHDGRTLAEWLRRPEENGERFGELFPQMNELRQEADVWGRAMIELKYAGYVRRQERMVEQQRDMETRPLPPGLDYRAVPQLRVEAAERWTAVRPLTVGQASRVSGIHPTDVTLLLLHLSARERTAHRTAPMEIRSA